MGPHGDLIDSPVVNRAASKCQEMANVMMKASACVGGNITLWPLTQTIIPVT
ncbi:hypothetical protein COLO4_05492 [Corchorus olitorius]|uniref:Uncharacterized protein n=1 Tax=Corchorus olitorius TaxID=93759 RepID=A0A1R3KQS6_9ROSI|nr:hypothetical protein COLO4_05492 [Corchorus olitorius]